jgi:subtilisin family serine protease/photosystem II stability/assembly factor-like uncharacterized protein
MRSVLSVNSHHRHVVHLAFLMVFFLLVATLPLSHTALGGDARQRQPHHQSLPAQAASDDVVPGIVVVKFRRSNPATDGSLRKGSDPLVSAVARTGVTSLARAFPMRTPLSDAEVKAGKVDLSRIHFASIPSTMDPVAVAKELSALPEVEYAGPKYRYHLAEVPNDSDYAVWQQRYFDLMHVVEGWAIQKGSLEVVIATVDGGTNWHHPDLAANIWINPAEDINHDGRFDPGDNDGIDQDGNGMVDDVIGWNFGNNTNDPQGFASAPGSADHGTETASEFGAVSNNGFGMAGTSWNCKIMPVCVADPTTDLNVPYGFEGIEYASRMGAKVINCSWYRAGGSGTYQQWEQDVITAVTEGGSLIVAAAGNEHLQNLDENPYFPASYEHVLSVGATNSSSDAIAYFTDIGLNVSVFAPGMAIRVAKNNGSYGTDQGTSHSSPLVAGLAGLLFSQHPDWTPEQVAEQIRITSDPIDTVNPDHAGSLGHGRVNFYRALSEVHSGIVVEAHSFQNVSGGKFFLEDDTVMLNIILQNVLTVAAENLLFSTTANSALIPLAPISAPHRLEAGASDSLTILFRVAHIAQKQIAKVRVSWSANGSEQDAHMFDTTVYGGEGSWERQWSPTMTPLTSVHAVNSRVAWAAGFTYGTDSSGEVLRTTDGGDNWVIVKNGFGQWSRWVFALDSLTAWLNVEGGKIYKTVDGGASWTQQKYPEPQAYYFCGFWFFDEANGYALGNPQSSGRKLIMLRTTDGGATWTHFSNEPIAPSEYYMENLAVWCTDTQHIWFGSADSRVWRTTNGGETWLFTTIGTSGVSGLAMRDDSVGVLCAGGGFEPEIFARTTNGGATWQPQPSPIAGGGLAAAMLPGSREAWIAGSHAVAYSPDEGTTWTLQPTDAFSIYVNAISFCDPENGWAVTDQGEILRYQVRNVVSGVRLQPDKNLPFRAILDQNYPNPFNPRTKIRFQVPGVSLVKLTVYDVLGREVVTLVNERRVAGAYEESFDGSRLASGVYFYRIQAGDFVSTKKFVLLK